MWRAMRVVKASLLLLGWLLCAASPLLRAQTTDDRPVILAVGESTTEGYGVPRDQSYPAQLQRLLDAAGYDYRVVNHGKSGSTTAQALTSLDRGVALLPKIVLIAIGGNDSGNSVAAERTERNLRKLVMMFVRTGSKVYLADRTEGSDGAASSLYATIAREEGATLMPSLREGFAGNPDLLISDMRHPNAAGYTIIANRIFTMLQPDLVRPK
jgi:acyl-CoA thioesterase-1